MPTGPTPIGRNIQKGPLLKSVDVVRRVVRADRIASENGVRVSPTLYFTRRILVSVL